MTKKRSAIVVGAGITGVSAAEWLRRDGWEVELIDRIKPGDPEQTSFGNGGLLARCAVIPVAEQGLIFSAPKMLLDPKSPLFMRWTYLPRLLPWLIPFLRNGRKDKLESISRALAALTTDSVDQHLTLARGTAAENFITQGEYTYLYRNRETFAKDAAGMALRRAFGFEYEPRDRAELLERDPHLGERYQFGAAFTQHGWITDPGGYVTALAEHFCTQGGRFRQAEVADITPGEKPAVTLKGGEVVNAEKIVLAAGIWSRKLSESLGQKTPLETERGYHLMLNNPSFKPATPYMVTDGKFVATPMESGLRCAGIVEFGGTKAPASAKPVKLLKYRIQQVYPTLTWESEQSWMGHRPSTIDSLPMLGNAPGAKGIIFAFGSQHIGLTIGPRLGRMVADIAGGRRSNVDLAPYRVGRFNR